MISPIQKALKLPAVKPGQNVERRAAFAGAVTTSRTWREFGRREDLHHSGMIAPASVPQVMIVDSFHHSGAVAEIRNQQRTTRRR